MLLSALLSCLFAVASSVNYPGGEALSALLRTHIREDHFMREGVRENTEQSMRDSVRESVRGSARERVRGDIKGEMIRDQSTCVSGIGDDCLQKYVNRDVNGDTARNWVEWPPTAVRGVRSVRVHIDVAAAMTGVTR